VTASGTAHVVGLPVSRYLADERAGTVWGLNRSAVYVDLGGFVAALTAPGVPLMPNGVGLARRPSTLGLLHRGQPVRAGAGVVRIRGLRVSWDPASASIWDPGIRPWPAVALASHGGRWPLSRGDPDRGIATLADRSGRKAFAAVVHGIGRRRPHEVAHGAAGLVGRGAGLTPEGDDLLGGVAAALRAFGPGAGIGVDALDRLSAALAPPSLEARTTALSATLLRLAVDGSVVEPVRTLADPDAADRWDAALRRLTAIGGSTGPAYAAGMAWAARTLVAPDGCSTIESKEE
jgi:hypothetical protein